MDNSARDLSDRAGRAWPVRAARLSLVEPGREPERPLGCRQRGAQLRGDCAADRRGYRTRRQPGRQLGQRVTLHRRRRHRPIALRRHLQLELHRRRARRRGDAGRVGAERGERAVGARAARAGGARVGARRGLRAESRTLVPPARRCHRPLRRARAHRAAARRHAVAVAAVRRRRRPLARLVQSAPPPAAQRGLHCACAAALPPNVARRVERYWYTYFSLSSCNTLTIRCTRWR